MYAMLTGVTLLIFSVLARLLARSAVHPSVAMPVTCVVVNPSRTVG